MKAQIAEPAQVRPALLKHQRGDVAWIQKWQRGLLANEPGTGKSRSAIEATQGARTLVVAPSMVIASGTWQDEISKWADRPELITVAPYSMLNERRAGRPISKLRDVYRQHHWEALIVDEAHYTKGRKTSWTWAVDRLAGQAQTLVEMTGTPIPNWSHELFPLLRAVFADETKPGQRFGSFWRWAQTWFDCSPSRWSNGNPVVGELLTCDRRCLERPANSPCKHYAEFIWDNFGEHYRRIRRDDVLDLPPLTEQPVEVPMTPAQRRVYREMKRHYTTTVSGTDVVSWSQGALNVALDRITTSPWLLTKEGPPRGGKLDRLAFDLTARSSPTLVLAHYRDSVDACAAVASQLGLSVRAIHGGTSPGEAADAFRLFKAGRLDVLCASLETVAEGAQLTAADMVIFVERSFKPYRNEQAKYRIHRLGQTRPCVALDYVCPQSVDAGKRRLLATKTDRQMRYLSAAEFLAVS